jgi:ubiquitin-protein ligase
MSHLCKRAWTELNKLKRLSLDSTSTVKFIIDTTPFDNDQTSPTNYTFIGRLLPMSDPFNQSALKIEIKLTNEYPGKPPEVRILTSIHHPNVLKDGKKKKKN